MPRPKITLRDILCLVTIAAVGLGWWLDRRHLAGELSALRRADELAKARQEFSSVGVPVAPLPNRCATPEQFITALREIDDWYEFADRTADPFVMTPVADEAVPALIALLRDMDPEIRTRAACTLGKMHRRAEEIVPALLPVLDDDGPNVRWHAAMALGEFGPDAKSAIPSLRRQVEDDQSPIAAFSAHMILSIDPTANVEPDLVRLLSSALVENRRRATQALRQKGSLRSKPALVEAFQRENDPEVRDSMAKAIAAIDSKFRSE